MDPNLHSGPSSQTAGPSQLAQIVLVVQNGRLSGSRHLLTRPLTLLGMGETCDVRLNATGVSSSHCLIGQTPAGLTIRDLGSETGTWINGTAVSSAVLHD